MVVYIIDKDSVLHTVHQKKQHARVLPFIC